MRPITVQNGKIYLLAGFSLKIMLRVEYSATLLPNGTIVYMGGKDPKDSPGKSVADGFRVDTTNYNWYEPIVSGESPTIKRFDHTANIIGRYMVIAFGSGTNFNFTYRNDVLLLDIGLVILQIIFGPLILILMLLYHLNHESSSPQPSSTQYNNNWCISYKILTTFPIPGNGENVKSDSSRASESSY
ncbi:hypothetical protein C1646_810469 [Rhizophagus diaphanus]|nr:hypothetical protein C1646_810469 [Rhizophagus diaphanus] [Rhizophagus sp. MUCL 43196]